jgi:hypothetical protein
MLASAGWFEGGIASTLIVTHGRGNPVVLGSPPEIQDLGRQRVRADYLLLDCRDLLLWTASDARVLGAAQSPLCPELREGNGQLERRQLVVQLSRQHVAFSV